MCEGHTHNDTMVCMFRSYKCITSIVLQARISFYGLHIKVEHTVESVHYLLWFTLKCHKHIVIGGVHYLSWFAYDGHKHRCAIHSMVCLWTAQAS